MSTWLEKPSHNQNDIFTNSFTLLTTADNTPVTKYILVKSLDNKTINLRIYTVIHQLGTELTPIIDKLVQIVHNSLPGNVSSSVTAQVFTFDTFTDMEIKISKSCKQNMHSTIKFTKPQPKKIVDWLVNKIPKKIFKENKSLRESKPHIVYYDYQCKIRSL